MEQEPQRSINQHRKISIQLGCLSQCKGSALYEAGQTKVLVAVYEPKEIPQHSQLPQESHIKKGRLQCELKFAPYLAGRCEKRERLFSSLMQTALEAVVCLELFPNLQIDVFAYVLDDDGSALSAAINCAGAAIAHAAIQMCDIVTAATLMVRASDGCFVIDPDSACERPPESAASEQWSFMKAKAKTETNEMEIDSKTKKRSRVSLDFDKPWSDLKMEILNALKEETQSKNDIIAASRETNRSDCGFVMVAKLNTHNELSLLYQTGSLDLDQIEKAVHILFEHCSAVAEVVDRTIHRFLTES